MFKQPFFECFFSHFPFLFFSLVDIKTERREPRTGDHSPMKFDQQTQTHTNMQNFEENSHSQGILLQQEIISEQVCSLAEENQGLRKQLTAMQHDMRAMKTNMESIHTTLFKVCDYLQVPNYDEPATTMRTVVEETPQRTANPPRILNLTNPLNSTPQPLSYSSMSIEPMIEASNDSIQSYSNQSYASPGTSFQSIYQLETSNTSDSSFSSSMKSRNNNTHSNNKMKIEKLDKHPDDEGNPSDEVVIGPNQTAISRSILLNINWASHTSATRRLLRAQFSREVLATHSLTGKPSPGNDRFNTHFTILHFVQFVHFMHGFSILRKFQKTHTTTKKYKIKTDLFHHIEFSFFQFTAFIESSKPTKHQLDPLIIGDIVSYVAKRCNVSETSVRSSITTKCADENKMMRQRMEKERRQSIKTEPTENKENSENKQIKNKGQESVQVIKPETILKQNNKK